MRFTETEDKVFSEFYPVLGYAGVMAQLPYLTENQIRERARELGLRCRRHIGRQHEVGRDPTPQTIQERCAQIRARWDFAQERRALGLPEEDAPPRDSIRVYRVYLPKS